MSGCIEFSWTTNHLLYPLVFSITYCLRFYCYNKLSSSQNSTIIFSFIMSLAELSNIVFEFIVNYRSNTPRIESEGEKLTLIDNNEHLQPSHLKKNKTYSFFTFFLIFISAILDIFSSVIITYLVHDLCVI